MKSINRAVKISLAIGLILSSFIAEAINTVKIKEEKPNYLLDIKYPQGFKSSEVNSAIKDLITNTQSNFLKSLSEDADTPADAPGKTGLNITYSIPYKSKDALSVRFNISIYHRGAAHPSHNVTLVNFIKGHQVKLSDLFTPGADYLKPISEFSNKEITAKKISDDKWISEGTKPTAENYDTWYFTNKGIAIVFNSYQVAAYVYGELIVVVPSSLLSSMIKPEISKMIWSS